jgi:hypothetical protein
MTAARRASLLARRVRRLASGSALLAAVGGCAEQASGPREAQYEAVLSGANERPPRSSGASGLATIHVTGNLASYTVTANGLADAVTVVHLLIGERETDAGQVVARLALVSQPGTVTSGTIASGTIDLGGSITFNNSTISGDSLRTLFERGASYVNVYTAAYPGGEIRGQLTRQP